MEENTAITENKPINLSSVAKKITPYILCALAGLSLIFTFLVGVSDWSQEGGTLYLYEFFKTDFASVSSHALKLYSVFGLIVSLLGLLCVAAFTGLTVYSAVKTFVYKKESKLEKFALCSFFAYVSFVSLFHAMLNGGFTGYNIASIIGIVLTSVVAVFYLVCKILANADYLKNTTNLTNFIYALIKLALMAVALGLLTSVAASVTVVNHDYSGGFLRFITLGAATPANEEKLSLLATTATLGFVVLAALTVLYVVLILNTVSNLFKKSKDDSVFYLVAAICSLLHLLFCGVVGKCFADLFVNDAQTKINIAVHVTIPVVTFVMMVLAYAAVKLQPVIVGAIAKRFVKTDEEEEGDENVLLEVKDLKKYFTVGTDFFGRPNASLKAVDGVSFKLEKGKTLGIVGESGCGKSTMGRSILRLYDGVQGKINFKGKNILKLSNREFDKLRPNIQMIFQDPYASLSPRITVGEIIGESARQHKLIGKEGYHQYVLDVMEMCGLQPHYFERYPHEFSGGQRQRICIARALALKPELVICDEPVSALDVSIQAQVINMLIDLRERLGLTYIFISHDLSVVKHISDDVGVMYLGNLVEYGSKKDIFEHTLHPYTKALFSAVPVPNVHVKMKRIMLKGDIPSPVNPPSGCKFHTRCEHCMDICTRIAPEYKEIEPGHFCACHLYNSAEDTARLEEEEAKRLAAEAAAEQSKKPVFRFGKGKKAKEAVPETEPVTEKQGDEEESNG